MKKIDVVVNLDAGLHARPATKFVQTAKSFASEITVISGEKTANAKSILEILTIGVTKGTAIVLQADGEDEDAALNALHDLVLETE